MQQENKMGVMKVNKLLLSVSLPMMISMLVQALYNVVDSVFVSHYDLKALTAVSLSFPYQNLMIAFSVGTGVGINALLSRNLGEKDFKGVNRAATNGIFVSAITCAVFTVIGVLISGIFFRLQSDDMTVIDYGKSYMGICSALSFALFGQVLFERLLQSTGKTFYTMITQGVGAILNIILDPIFIFVFDLGAAGAAIATVIGQFVAMLLAIYYNISKNKEIQLSFKGFKPHGSTIKKIYLVGVPSILVASIGSVMTFGVNKIFYTFKEVGEQAVNVFGVYFKLQSFAFMPLFGLNNGMVPIISYNMGARKKDRVIKTIKLSVMYAEIIMIAFMFAMQIFPEQMLKIFNANDEMLKIGVPALRTISLSYIAAAFCIISSSVFQSTGHAFLSMIVSLVRQLFVLLPVVYLIATITNSIYDVWYAYPIAECFSLALSAIFLRYVYKKEIKPL